MPEISEKLICLIYRAPVIVSLCILLSLGLKSSSGSQLWHFGRTRQRDILQTYTGQTKPHSWKGTWNESGVKWPSSASLRTINRSPFNLRTLKPCLPSTHVITRPLCLHVLYDAWVRSSALCPSLLPWSCSRFLPCLFRLNPFSCSATSQSVTKVASDNIIWDDHATVQAECFFPFDPLSPLFPARSSDLVNETCSALVASFRDDCVVSRQLDLCCHWDPQNEIQDTDETLLVLGTTNDSVPVWF